MFVDAVACQAEDVIERSHPLRVTLCQVIVDGHNVYATACEGSQIDRQRSHEGLTFTGGHLSNLTLMQHYAAYDLHVVVHHIPCDGVTSCDPAVAVKHAVALDVHVLAFCRELTVEVGGSSLNHLIFLETTGSLLHHGEGLGLNLVQGLLNLLKHLLVELVDLLIDVVFLFKIHVGVGVDAGFQLSDLSLFLSDLVFDIFLKLYRLMTKAVDVQILDFLVCLKRFLQ